MFPKYIGLFKATLIALLLFLPVVYAEDYSNTINSVSVKQSGNDGVVVDVYVNSKNKNVKPEISTRKHGDKQFVIDLMKVTKAGNVSKSASESSGMVENKGVHVGNTSGGSARVVLDLNNPNVKVKNVRYHFVDDKNNPSSKPANPSDQNKQAQKNKETKSVIQDKQQVKSMQTPIKKTAKASTLATGNTKQVVINTTKKSNVKAKPASVNVVTHKTNNKNQVLYSKQGAEQKKIITQTKKSMNLDETAIASAPISNNVEHKGSSSQVKHLFHKVQPVTTPVRQKEKSVTENLSNKKILLSKSAKVVDVKPKQEHLLMPPKQVIKPEENIKSVSEQSIENQKQMLAQAKEDTVKPVSHSDNKTKNTKPQQQKQVTNIEHTPVNFENEVIEGGNIRTVNNENSGVDPMGMLFTLIGALVVIVPLIFFVAWLINIFYKGGNAISIGGFGSLEGAKFKILASTSLGQGKSIHLVEIRGRQLVIGCTSTSINVLSEFTEFDEFVESEENDSIKEIPVKQTTKFKKNRTPTGGFTELYKNYQGKVDQQQDLEDEY